MQQQRAGNAMTSQAIHDSSLERLHTSKRINQRLHRIEEHFVKSMPSIENAKHIPPWLQHTIKNTVVQTIENQHRLPRHNKSPSMRIDERSTERSKWSGPRSPYDPHKNIQPSEPTFSNLSRNRRRTVKKNTHSNSVWYSCLFGKILLQTSEAIMLTPEAQCTTTCRQKYIHVSLFPASWIFNIGATMIFCSIATELRRPTFQLQFRAFNIIPEESSIIKAALEQDVDTARQLFVRREASPYDRTVSGRTLLEFAIECLNPSLHYQRTRSGADDLDLEKVMGFVRLLIDCDIDTAECAGDYG